MSNRMFLISKIQNMAAMPAYGMRYAPRYMVLNDECKVARHVGEEKLLCDVLVALSKETGGLSGGAGGLSGGAGGLSGGAGSLSGGAGSLSGGAGSLSGGAGSLSGGAGSLSEGAGSLSGGAGSLSEEKTHKNLTSSIKRKTTLLN